MYMCRCIYRLWINRYFYKNSPLKLSENLVESPDFGVKYMDISKLTSENPNLDFWRCFFFFLPFWRYLWFGWIFSGEIGSHMVRQNVESFQARSFLLDWPVWPQNAVSHLAKSWGVPSSHFWKTNPGWHSFHLPFLGKHTKIFRKKFVFEIRGT